MVLHPAAVIRIAATAVRLSSRSVRGARRTRFFTLTLSLLPFVERDSRCDDSDDEKADRYQASGSVDDYPSHVSLFLFNKKSSPAGLLFDCVTRVQDGFGVALPIGRHPQGWRGCVDLNQEVTVA